MSIYRDPMLQGGVDLAKSGLKYGFRTLAVVTTVTLVITYFLHRSSYCISEGRFVSDKEMITVAVTDEIRYFNNPGHTVVSMKLVEKVIPFVGTEEFQKENPGCCKILTGDEEKTALHLYGFLDRLFGYYAVIVGLNYTAKYIDMEGIDRQLPVHSEVPVSSCGKIHLESLRGG